MVHATAQDIDALEASFDVGFEFETVIQITFGEFGLRDGRQHPGVRVEMLQH